MSKEKSSSVKIISISSNEKGVYGLGNNQAVYKWDVAEAGWFLHTSSVYTDDIFNN